MAGGAGKDKSQFNPTRLFVSGLAPGVTKTNLKEMFPKSASADIPQSSRKKGTSYGFVQFSTPSDAKSAFDAAQSLEISGHPITVLFAKKTEMKDDVVKKKKAEKRKIKQEKRKAENNKDRKAEGSPAKKRKTEIVKEEESEDENDQDQENDNDDSEEEEEEENVTTAANENQNQEEDDEDDDEDDE